jgi:hemolysin activation/secretion protein
LPRPFAAAARLNESTTPNAPSKFSLRPPAILGRPWDLSPHSFVDVGQTYNNRILTRTEANRTLVGAGIGIELAVLRDSKPDLTGLRSFVHDTALTLRLDWGIALDPVETLTTNPVYIGNSRLHFAGTIAF